MIALAIATGIAIGMFICATIEMCLSETTTNRKLFGMQCYIAAITLGVGILISR